jgi:hydrogenase expression/formation protein HypC
MCLGEIVRLDAVSGSSGVAHVGERALTISLVTLEESVTAGDWVVVHSGFALERLDADEAADALSLRSGEPSSPATHHPTADPQEES